MVVLLPLFLFLCEGVGMVVTGIGASVVAVAEVCWDLNCLTLSRELTLDD